MRYTMSRKLWAFLLSDFKIIRVICQNTACQSVVELPIANLASRFEKTSSCKHCGHVFYNSTNTNNPFTLLAEAIEAFKTRATGVEIEFAIPDETP